VNEIADAKPKTGVTVMVEVPLPPLATEMELGLSDRVNAGVPTITLTAADVEPAKVAFPPY
jgi:hypothetical protein